MNLAELKDIIDKYSESLEKSGTPLEKVSVEITLEEPSVGPRASSGVDSIFLGFDWETNQLRIEPTKKIASLGRRLDDIKDCVKKVYTGKDTYWCPRCANQVKEKDNFCKCCGQKMRAT